MRFYYVLANREKRSLTKVNQTDNKPNCYQEIKIQWNVFIASPFEYDLFGFELCSNLRSDQIDGDEVN